MRRLLVLLLTTVVGVTLGLASAAPAQAASVYTISGTITGRDANGALVPLADAYLYAQPVDWEDNRNIYGDADANGRFSIDVGTAGDYTLYAECLPSTPCAGTHAMQYYDQANGHGDAKTIVLSTGTPTATANIRLPRFATVKGKVTSTAGAPLAGITVESAPTAGGRVISTTTDATGAYTLDKAVPGKVNITARQDWDKHDWNAEYWNGGIDSTPTYPSPAPTLPEGPTVTTANFQARPHDRLLRPGRRLRGRAHPGHRLERAHVERRDLHVGLAAVRAAHHRRPGSLLLADRGRRALQVLLLRRLLRSRGPGTRRALRLALLGQHGHPRRRHGLHAADEPCAADPQGRPAPGRQVAHRE